MKVPETAILSLIQNAERRHQKKHRKVQPEIVNYHEVSP